MQLLSTGDPALLVKSLFTGAYSPFVRRIRSVRTALSIRDPVCELELFVGMGIPREWEKHVVGV